MESETLSPPPSVTVPGGLTAMANETSAPCTARDSAKISPELIKPTSPSTPKVHCGMFSAATERIRHHDDGQRRHDHGDAEIDPGPLLQTAHHAQRRQVRMFGLE